MKPALTWSIALGGLLLLAGAMAWATHSLMGMERTQHRMAAEAALQERSRLALWRMESIAASLVVEESARPPEQYRTGPASAPPVSPASRIQLHFELDADGRLRSPQVTDGPDKPPVPDESGLRLQELRARLNESASPAQWVLLGLPSQTAAGLNDNRAWLFAVNAPAAPVTGAKSAPAAKEPAASATDSLSTPAAVPAPAPTSAPSPPPAPARADYAPPQLPTALKPAEAKEEQDLNNKKESEMRQQAVGNLAKVAASQRRQLEETVRLEKNKNASPLLQAQAPVPAPLQRSAAAPAVTVTPVPSSPTVVAAAPADAPAAPAAMASAAESSSAGGASPEKAAVAADQRPLVSSRDSADPDRAAPAVTISDFRSLWIKDALLLTRRVSQDGVSLIQGAWVDWPRLRSDLLAAVGDLFPAASLEPAPAINGGGTDLLASLPIRFRPGLLTMPAPRFWSPLKLSLATAWACVLLASVAVATVLRGMMRLSERRAAFVSAVTHELRTPLATFKLYSEMLADGLVRDPAKRQSYLETLTTEADRLGHLVENVLSYSRLERGKPSEGRTRLTLGSLLDRTGPRLHQRVTQAGATFTVISGGVPDAFPLSTDASAVEQILFNLVDNACKYGTDGTTPARIELVCSSGPGKLRLAVRDYGPGLTRQEARKLFRPFHKSAREAAHSAPGVGLGLALCRRLAHDLKGSLETDHSWPQGACFVLTLPAD